MERQHIIVAKVLLTNHRDQILLFDELSSQLDEYRKTKEMRVYEKCEELLRRWRVWSDENEQLLQKYIRLSPGGEDEVELFEKMNMVVGCQSFIKQGLDEAGSKWPLDLQQEIVLWAALQKYSCYQ